MIDIRRPWGLEWYSDDSSIIRHNTMVWRPASQCFFNVTCGQDRDHQQDPGSAGNRDRGLRQHRAGRHRPRQRQPQRPQHQRAERHLRRSHDHLRGTPPRRRFGRGTRGVRRARRGDPLSGPRLTRRGVARIPDRSTAAKSRAPERSASTAHQRPNRTRATAAAIFESPPDPSRPAPRTGATRLDAISSPGVTPGGRGGRPEDVDGRPRQGGGRARLRGLRLDRDQRHDRIGAHGQHVGLGDPRRPPRPRPGAAMPAPSAAAAANRPRRARSPGSRPDRRAAALPTRSPAAWPARPTRPGMVSTSAGCASMSCDRGVSSSTRACATARRLRGSARSLGRGHDRDQQAEPDQDASPPEHPQEGMKFHRLVRSASDRVIGELARPPALPEASEEDHRRAGDREREQERQCRNLPLDALVDHLAAAPCRAGRGGPGPPPAFAPAARDRPGSCAARPPPRSPSFSALSALGAWE